jgi:hypothetical protein
MSRRIAATRSESWIPESETLEARKDSFREAEAEEPRNGLSIPLGRPQKEGSYVGSLAANSVSVMDLLQSVYGSVLPDSTFKCSPVYGNSVAHAQPGY